MPPVLTYAPRAAVDPAADELRNHLYRLLEPSTYWRLAPADPSVPHPATEQGGYLRRYLETRNHVDRVNRAAMVVAGWPWQEFARPEIDRDEAVDIDETEVA